MMSAILISLIIKTKTWMTIIYSRFEETEMSIAIYLKTVKNEN